ncbi:hypothetical protein LTR04_005212 [Oleoguttula sp. CCFEE 6159]|nr:hypothetical protein LTR04_005212 [Oleoguttula sp. CCFEE 6159]
MPPRVHCVRHAQGYHNLTVANHNMHDPLLTPFGEEQCRELRSSFPYHSAVDLVVASPIKRTVYTALIGFSNDLASKDLKVIALPELQETSDLPCDTGSSPEEAAREFRGKPVDLTLVQEGWNSKKGKWAPTAKAIENRAREARQWLMSRPEKDIVVVTHGGFLHYFTEDWTSNRFQGMSCTSISPVSPAAGLTLEALPGTGWANTEFRSYSFDVGSGDNASLVETDESRRRRAGTETPLTREEKLNLKQTAHSTWERQGFQQKGEPNYQVQSKV